MRKTPLTSLQRFKLLPAMLLALAAAAHGQQQPSPVEAALRALASAQDVTARSGALGPLLAESGVDVQGMNATHVDVVNLLHSHPEQAEQIRKGLISALEQQGAEYQRLVREDRLPKYEGYADMWNSLTQAVAALQDPRAVKGLILALPAGSMEGLADICPDAVDAIIQRAHEPDLDLQGDLRGINVGYRWRAVWTLGLCLQRPALMHANPQVAGKIRGALLSLLDESDPVVRGGAADALSALRSDPEVRTKLQVVAGSDPHFERNTLPNGGPGRFTVRDTAARALDAEGLYSSYVTRTSETRSCRIQQASEPVTGERIIGPELRDSVRRAMCSHYDPTGQDLSWCWRVEPLNACMQ